MPRPTIRAARTLLALLLCALFSREMTVPLARAEPVITVPGPQTAQEDTDTALPAIGVSDASVGSTFLQVTLAVEHGVLTMNKTTGLIFVAGDGVADSTMTVIGKQTDLATALTSLVYRGNQDYNGGDRVKVTASPATDLRISFSNPPNTVNSGSRFSYALKVANNGPGVATNVVVRVTLNGGATNISAGGDNWSCTLSGNTVTCRVASLSAGEAALDLLIQANAPTSGAIVAEASVSTTTEDINPSNNTANASTSVSQARLAVEVPHPPSTVIKNNDFYYLVKVKNNGPDVAEGIKVEATFSNNARDLDGLNQNGWTCTENQPNDTITCEYGPNLANGATAPPLTLKVQAPNATATVTMTAVVSSDTEVNKPERQVSTSVVDAPTNPLSRTSWTAVASSSASGDPAGDAIDGNSGSRWKTGDGLQLPGQYFKVSMDAVRIFGAIVLDTTDSPNDWPRGYEVYLSTTDKNPVDRASWGAPVATGTGAPLTLITFTPTNARYILIVQTESTWLPPDGDNTRNFWSIHELNVYYDTTFQISSSAAATTTKQTSPARTTVALQQLSARTAATASFPITVQPVNDAPTISGFNNEFVLVNTTTAPLPFSVADVDTPLDALTITAESSNQAVVANANIAISGSGANRTLTITPAPGQQGTPTATITVRVSDGTATTSASFTLTVTPQPWLALLYLAGDDVATGSTEPSLTKPIEALVEQLNTMPYNPAVRIVALYDGNKTGDSKVYVREPDGLRTVVADLWPTFPTNNELDTGSVTTLSAFVNWARANYPAQHTMLSIVDHGGGWAPDFGDPPGQGRSIRIQAGGWRGMSLDIGSGGTALSTRGTREALNGVGSVDVLFFDACLMGMIESAYEVRDAADYFIAGENLLFAELPYDSYLASGNLTAATTPRELALSIVARYNATPEAERQPFTIAALDLQQLRGDDTLAARVNTLAARLLTALPDPVAADNPLQTALRTIYAQSQKFDYDSSGTIDATDGYVDLADFARRLRDAADPAIPADVKQAATAVVEATVGTAQTQRVSAGGPVVIGQRTVSGTYNGQPWDFTRASGLAIYLPLGEHDNRPTKVDPANLAQPAQPERQLNYYTDPAQLTWTRDAPRWAELLVRLEPTTPQRDLAQRPFVSPNQLAATRFVYLPLTTRR